MATKAAKRLFRSITTNSSLVLNRPLHKVKTTGYNLRLATKKVEKAWANKFEKDKGAKT